MRTETESTPERPTAREDFAELSRRVRREGLFARRSSYYVIKIAATIGGLAALFGAAVLIGDSWWNLFVAAGLAFVLAQIGFISHDAGHRQVWARRRGNDAIGLVVTNLLAGFSFSWWLSKHNRHHAFTSVDGKDPDIDAGALVFTTSQVDRRGPLGKLFARVQSFTLIPLLFLEAVNLRAASVVALARRRDRAALLEVALLAVHALVFFVTPFVLLTPLRAVVFIVVTQSLLGFYLGASFLTNHVGMPTLTGEDDLGFLRRQVLTSRNLSGPSLTGFIFGGLDSQIEHHLFPAMPRANLRRARKVVRQFCAEQRISYAEQSPWRAYGDIFRHLQRVGGGRAVSVIN
jgi:fatty acid desaturase